ncbi:MAG: vitamin K epoxide reductase family protein [Bdellovibrionota bacterium]
MSRKSDLAATAFLNIAWAVLLISNPLMMNYGSQTLARSDIFSGLSVIVLSSLMLFMKKPWIRWLICSVGIWLVLAPLVFWAPTAAEYSNDTLLGLLILASSAILPGIGAVSHDASDIPRGWSYNPSSWSQRLPIIGLAFAGFLIAKYLAAFQLGHIDAVWDPFFGDGTERILKSDVSRAFPVSDAGLGAFSYLLDALSGGVGDKRRWRTMPWMVVLFGVMIIPPGVTSITLVILQPTAVGAWCTLCLATALIMLFMVPPAIDEVVATFQFLRQSKAQGKSLWKTFWLGDSSIEANPPTRISRGSHMQPQSRVPLNLILSTLLGAWLMFMPSIFGLRNLAAHNGHFAGALVVTFAIIAMSEVARPLRFVNTILGLWLLAASWLLDGGNLIGNMSYAVTGMFLVILSIPMGKVAFSYGSYDRIARWQPFQKKKNHLSEGQKNKRLRRVS